MSFSKFDIESTTAEGGELTAASCNERKIRSKVAINGTQDTMQMDRLQ